MGPYTRCVQVEPSDAGALEHDGYRRLTRYELSEATETAPG
jgi:hypothetical protein